MLFLKEFFEKDELKKSADNKKRIKIFKCMLNFFQGDSMDSERRFSVPASLQKTADNNFILRTQTPSHQTSGAMAYHGFDSPRVQNRHSDHVTRTDQSGALFGHVPYLPGGYHSSPYLPGDVSDSHDSREFKDNSVPIVNTQQTSLVSASLPSVLSHLHFPSVSLPRQPVTNSDDHSVLTLEDSLHSLRSSLEDYHGQYTELQKLEDLLRKIEKLSRVIILKSMCLTWPPRLFNFFPAQLN